ncbi:T9SS type A sorting domain-containing protein [candidate division KSB1 bacterium]|nr:T9SS type A sorting domain-containing protein [candidate division KSB1 bacterium]
MEKKNSFLIYLLVTVFLLVSVQLFSSEQEDLIKIQQAIQAKGAKWTAGSNWVTKLSREEQKRLCGAIMEKPDPSEAKLLTLPQIENLPAKLDWRDNNGNWVTPVTNQGACGSCWDFSAVAQIEAWWKIKNANLDSMPDLSEQFVLSCSDGGCDGWSVAGALDFVKANGIPTEACFGYLADDTVPCDNVCPEWQNEAITIPGWGFVTLEEAIVDNIKNAVFRHPVSVSYIVYQDFMAYSGGVYEHVWGEVEAGHAVLIVGWDDELECWIVKNSWGPNWGESGYFRIKWGDSGMGSYSPFIWDEIITEPSLALSTNEVGFSLTVGDSAVEYVTVYNTGSKLLHYSSADYKLTGKFHSDDFNSFDGHSWWCGDPELGGYIDHCLHYLQTPAIDLSTTTSPKLNFMVNWSMEDSAGADPPWDGWDGCNVWVSVDSGETFDVINPTTPEYTCQSMWSFGHPEQGWDFGEGIPGWAGISGGWLPAEFDLTPYISDNVVICFALASDLAYCTIDDPKLKGFFVDEIKVTEGYSILFENNGEDNGDMHVEGIAGESITDWLNTSNGAGVIEPNGSKEMEIIINTRELIPGKYFGNIKIMCNDTSLLSSAEIDVNLELVAPQYDLAIKDVWLPGESIPILFPVELGATVVNMGQNDHSNFDVLIMATNKGQPFYSDTTHVDILLVDETKMIKFDPLLVTEPGELDFSISLMNLTDDYNDYNNTAVSISQVSNLIDGFEVPTNFWDFQGGWGLSDMGGSSGNSCVHVNGGKLPYAHNMNAIMTFIPGLDVSAIDKLTLKFWARYLTEEDKDVCYVEASGDQANWTQLYSLSGNGFKWWSQHEVGLRSFIEAGYEKVWFRFRFVSDGEKSFVGVLIDDIEVYITNPTDVKSQPETTTIPTEWKLFQNYPNPFNMDTNFSYSLKETGDVKLTIFNVNGKVVRNLVNLRQSAGSHTISWDGRDNSGNVVGSGVYLYQLKVRDKFFDTRKMILLK